MKIYSFNELVSLARKNSPFYREYYSNVSETLKTLDEVPVLDLVRFWEANSVHDNQVMTSPMSDGYVFSSGGTTGKPKFSYYTVAEFESFAATFGRAIVSAGLKSGDRVANFLRTGQLYGAFIIISQGIEMASEKAFQLPLAGTTPPEQAFQIIQDFKANAILGFPTVITNLASFFLENRSVYKNVKIDKIFYTGEATYPAQKEIIESAFPGVAIRSMGYASVDAGPLGFADLECRDYEHRVYLPETIFEIVDEETGQTISEVERPGKVVVTNLTRLTVPIIRYPVGDRAIWVEPEGISPNRKFRLVGRSGEAARIASITVHYEEVRKMLNEIQEGEQILGFQIILERKGTLDLFILRVAINDTGEKNAHLAKSIEEKFYKHFSTIPPLIQGGRAHPVQIEIVRPSHLETNERTGKMKRIIDRRF